MAEQPQWQPISQLPIFIAVIEPWLRDVEEHYDTLRQAQARPHVLDDATVARIIKVYTAQKNDIWLYQEQIARWRQTPLSPREQQGVAQLEQQINQLAYVIDAILTLAEKLKESTIEQVLAKDDAQLGLELLLGKRKF